MEKKLSDSERAEMFYKECMENAGIEEFPPFNSDDEWIKLHTELNDDAC